MDFHYLTLTESLGEGVSDGNMKKKFDMKYRKDRISFSMDVTCVDRVRTEERSQEDPSGERRDPESTGETLCSPEQRLQVIVRLPRTKG